jgi:transcriptional regulator with XRE-family HTH domain
MSNPKPGTMLKNLRVGRGWKLSDLAERTGLQVSTLSKMENGKVALTYDKLAQISKALDVDVGSFFGPPRGAAAAAPTLTGRRSVIRAGEGQEIETDTYHHIYQATDLLNKRFIPMVSYPYAKSMEEFGEWIRHPGEEYTYVLEGTVDFYSELYAPVRLEKGDAIYFDSGMGHAYIKVGDEPCRGLTICAGDEAQSIPGREPAVHRANNVTPVVLEPIPTVTPSKSVQKIRTGS